MTKYISLILLCFIPLSCVQKAHHDSESKETKLPPIELSQDAPPVVISFGEEEIYGNKFKNQDEYKAKFLEYQSALAHFIMNLSTDNVDVCLNGTINEKGDFEEIGSHTQPFSVTTLTKDDLREINNGAYFYTKRMTGIMFNPLSTELYTRNENGDYIQTYFHISVNEEEKGFVFLKYKPNVHGFDYSIIIKSPRIWEKMITAVTRYKKKPYLL